MQRISSAASAALAAPTLGLAACGEVPSEYTGQELATKQKRSSHLDRQRRKVQRTLTHAASVNDQGADQVGGP